MEKIVNILAALGGLFLFVSFFDTSLKDVFLNVGFFIWAIMNIFNAKRYHDKGESKKVVIILICAIVLFGVSIRELWMNFHL